MAALRFLSLCIGGLFFICSILLGAMAGGCVWLAKPFVNFYMPKEVDENDDQISDEENEFYSDDSWS